KHMIKSMTGFGRGEYSDGGRNVTVEIRSVNHRYGDITVKMPRRYSFAEETVKTAVKDVVKRGKADVSVMVDTLTEGDLTVRLNEPAAAQYMENLRALQKKHRLAGEIDIALLSSMPDVLRTVPDVEDEKSVKEAVGRAAAQAAEAIDAMRIAEGGKLAEDLMMRGRLIRDIVRQIGERAPQIAGEYVMKMKERIAELLDGAVEIPEERILTEAAIFADKSNITEELVRLDSHMQQLGQILTKAEDPAGKKLDFLVQEMNREANTIGSKANDLEITSWMLETKSEIEKIREQVQNIE
ncbi:MAG: YicC/YloC family endoribonuclease, partial [Bacillota bacterium]|nr:YicC/YloC family endoribonuclease [Bacillota bacterium]